MKQVTANVLYNEINKALGMFGSYTFQDKGAFDVVDYEIFHGLKQKTPSEILDVVLETEKMAEESKDTDIINAVDRFIGDFVVCSDEMPDEWWNELMTVGNGKFEEYY